MVIFFHFSLGLGMGRDIILYPLEINIIQDNLPGTFLTKLNDSSHCLKFHVGQVVYCETIYMPQNHI